jgi:hypothetical protein
MLEATMPQINASAAIRRVMTRVFVFVFSVLLGAESALAFPSTPAELQAIFDSLIKTGLRHGDIPSLYRPQYISVMDAANGMEGIDQVFIVAMPDGVRIYPQKIMVWHEVLNEIIDGKAYIVTYSPISGSLAAYAAMVDGQNLTFDSEGRVYNNTTVLIDRNTGSLWSQVMGISFHGALSGRGLKMLPVLWTQWQYARKAFPKAKVLGIPRHTNRTYGRDPYGSYDDKESYYYNDEIVYPLYVPLDRRLKPKVRVLGLEIDTSYVAIDESYVKKSGCVNFFLGPYPLLAYFDRKLNAVLVFNRTVWDQPALFRVENGKLIDIDTQSVWNSDGQAISGNLAGASLEPLFGIYSFWFAWAAHHQGSELVPGPGVVPESALIKGEALP